MKRRLKTGASLVALCGLALVLSSPAFALTSAGPLSAPEPAPAAPVETAPAHDGEIVRDIEVEGAVRLERDTILSYLTIAKGTSASAQDMNASL